MLVPENEKELKAFGDRLGYALKKHRVTQSDIARIFAIRAQVTEKTALQVVSQMIGGKKYRLTERNFLHFLSGFAYHGICQKPEDADDWLEDFYNVKGTKHRVPLKDLGQEGKAILIEIENRKAEREHEASNDEPKYTTSHSTPLIGREKDIAAVWSLLLEKEIRLLTLTGAPGVGKTELVLQIENLARGNDAFDLIYFISLENVENNEDVIPTINKYIRGKSISTEDDAKQLIKYLQRKRVLIILDNYEVIIDARVQIEKLLKDCLNLKFLITSRRRLNLLIEREYPVPSLEIPPIEDARHLLLGVNKVPLMKDFDFVQYCLDHSAVKLFVERVQARDISFTLKPEDAMKIVELCAMLDCLPLTITIIASRIKDWGLEELYKRVEEDSILELSYAFTDKKRLTSIAELINWSYYKLLDVSQQKLFRRLAAFRGGCTLEAVRQVCNLNDLPDNLINLLNDLSDCKLILIDQENQRIKLFHNTIHAYALHILSLHEDERKDVQERHRNFYLEKALLAFETDINDILIFMKNNESFLEDKYRALINNCVLKLCNFYLERKYEKTLYEFGGGDESLFKLEEWINQPLIKEIFDEQANLAVALTKAVEEDVWRPESVFLDIAMTVPPVYWHLWLMFDHQED